MPQFPVYSQINTFKQTSFFLLKDTIPTHLGMTITTITTESLKLTRTISKMTRWIKFARETHTPRVLTNSIVINLHAIGYFCIQLSALNAYKYPTPLCHNQTVIFMYNLKSLSNKTSSTYSLHADLYYDV